VTLSETIFSGFRLKYARESQQLLRDAASFENEHNRNKVAFSIVQTFFNLYKLKASAVVVQKNLEQIKERVRETQLAQKNGIAIKNDVLRWQLQQTNVELAMLDIQNNIDIVNFDFNLMLGLNGDKKIIPDSNSVNDASQPKSLEAYFSQSAKSRKDIVAADLYTKAAYNVLKVAQNSYLPRVSIAGEFLDARPNVRYIPPVDKFNTTWSAGIALNWDLLNLYSNKHNVDEARSLYRQSLESYNSMSDEIKSEINQNFLYYTESIQKKEVMEKGVEQAAENFRLMDSRYKNSLVMLSELLDANNQLLNAQINLTYAKADIQIAYYRLLKSTGSIL
jgi:outer membrane protein TolC